MHIYIHICMNKACKESGRVFEAEGSARILDQRQERVHDAHGIQEGWEMKLGVGRSRCLDTSVS